MKRLYGLVILLYINNICTIGLFTFSRINLNYNTDFIFNIWGKIIIISIIYFILAIIFIVINSINIINKYKNKDIENIMKYTEIVKIYLIPFWIIHIIGNLLLYNGAFNGSIISLIILMLIILFSCILYIIISFYSLSFLFLLKYNSLLCGKELVLNIIMQFIILLDSIGIILLSKKYKKMKLNN
jgi:hypothetical protein